MKIKQNEWEDCTTITEMTREVLQVNLHCIELAILLIWFVEMCTNGWLQFILEKMKQPTSSKYEHCYSASLTKRITIWEAHHHHHHHQHRAIKTLTFKLKLFFWPAPTPVPAQDRFFPKLSSTKTLKRFTNSQHTEWYCHAHCEVWTLFG